ncbi:MAG TPA: response regulator [Acidimicrobiales bacterium]|nr:response regulator [Acidimicrobiales bacterium]
MTDPVVLVVDDQEAIRRSVAELLRSAGYEAVEAENGDQALQVLQLRNVAAVVLDVRMPKTDGLGVLDALENPPPVILMSAFEMGSDDQDRIDRKIFVQLVKPFHPRRLLEAVAAAIGPASAVGDG